MLLSTIALFFFCISSVILLLIFSKGSFRRSLIVISTLIFVLLMCSIAFLVVFKSQIQQGKIFPQLGAILILISPPEDLWVPLSSDYLISDKNEYELDIRHKYVGNHEILFSFEKVNSSDILEKAGKELLVTVEFEHNSKVIYSTTSKLIIAHYGYENQALSFIRYFVPDDCPIGAPLKVRVKVEGSTEQFIEKYGPTRIEIMKGSDL